MSPSFKVEKGKLRDTQNEGIFSDSLLDLIKNMMSFINIT